MEILKMSTKKKNPSPVVDVCSMIMKQVEKPEGFDRCKAINVYDNRYRINFYCKYYDKTYDIYKTKIGKSYFAHLDGDNLIIKM